MHTHTYTNLHIHLICNNLIGVLHVPVCVLGEYRANILFQERLFCFLSQKETKLIGLEKSFPQTPTPCVFLENIQPTYYSRKGCFASSAKMKHNSLVLRTEFPHSRTYPRILG